MSKLKLGFFIFIFFVVYANLTAQHRLNMGNKMSNDDLRIISNIQRTADDAQRTADDGLWAINNEQLTLDNKQWTIDNGQRTINNGKRANDADSYFGWEGHFWYANRLVFSGDGTIIISSGADGTIRFWDVQKNVLIKTIPAHNNEILSFCISPDGTKIATASMDCTAKLWDVKSGKLIRIIETTQVPVYSTAFSTDGKIIATGGLESKVKLWNAEDGSLIRELTGHTSQVSCITFSPDGKKIISLSEGDKTIKIWDLKEDTLINSIKTNGYYNTITLLPDGTRFISGYNKGFSPSDIILWDLDKASIIRIFSGTTFGIMGTFCLSPDGTKIAVGCDDFNIRIIDISTGKQDKIFYEHKLWIYSLAFSPDGSKLVSTSIDGTMKLWDVKTASELKTFADHSATVNQFIYSPDGKKLVSGGVDAVIKMWDPRDGSLLKEIKKHDGSVISLAFSPEGTKFASIAWDQMQVIYIWDASTGNLIKSITNNTDGICGVAFSPDGKKIASGSVMPNITDRTIKIWDANTGDLLKIWKCNHIVWALAFSPDGTTLASGGGDYFDDLTVKLWDVNTGKLMVNLYGYTGLCRSLSFSPDGTKLASASIDSTVRVWDVPNSLLYYQGILLYQLKDLKDGVWSARFSPDGKNLLAGSNDGIIKIWNIMDTPKLIRTIIFDQGHPTSLCYSPDGNKIASGGWGYNNLRIYDLNTSSVNTGESKFKDFKLFHNYPNPFNPYTIINYQLPINSFVTLKIYDLLGRELTTLVNENQITGIHNLTWEPKNVPAGMYFCRLQAGNYVDTKKIVYVK